MNYIRPFRRMPMRRRGDSFGDFYNMIDSFFKDDYQSNLASVGTFKVDIKDEGDKYFVEAEVPGYDKEDLEINVEDGKIFLSASHNTEVDESDQDSNYIYKERSTSSVSRVMSFPDMDEENLKASLDKGILTIEVPKKEEGSTGKRLEIE